VAGLAPGNTLYFFVAQRAAAADDAAASSSIVTSLSVSLQLSCDRKLPSKPEMNAVCCASATLCGISDAALHNIGAGTVHKLAAPVLCYTVTDERVFLSHGSCLTIVEPAGFRVHVVNLSNPAVEVRMHPGKRFLACRAHSRANVSVVNIVDLRRGSGAVVGRVSLAGTVASMGFSADGALAVCEDSGVLSLWSIVDATSGASLVPAPLLPPSPASSPPNVRRDATIAEDVTNAAAAPGAGVTSQQPSLARKRASSAARESQNRRYAELTELAHKTGVRPRHMDACHSSGLLFSPEAQSRIAVEGRARWEVPSAVCLDFPLVSSRTASCLEGAPGDSALRPDAPTTTVRHVPREAPARPPGLPTGQTKPIMVSPLAESETVAAVAVPQAPPILPPAEPLFQQAPANAARIEDDDESDSCESFDDLSASAAAELLAAERARVRDSELQLGRGTSPVRKGDDAGNIKAVAMAAANDEDDDIVLMSSLDGLAAAPVVPYAAVVFAAHKAPDDDGDQQQLLPATAHSLPLNMKTNTIGTSDVRPSTAAGFLREAHRRLSAEAPDDAEDDELELATAVADVIAALHERRAQRRPQSASGSSAGRQPVAAGSSVATSIETLSQFLVVRTEMQRIREQNDRIELQNKSILEALARLSSSERQK
jgi:hypothetical protein